MIGVSPTNERPGSGFVKPRGQERLEIFRRSRPRRSRFAKFCECSPARVPGRLDIRCPGCRYMSTQRVGAQTGHSCLPQKFRNFQVYAENVENIKMSAHPQSCSHFSQPSQPPGVSSPEDPPGEEMSPLLLVNMPPWASPTDSHRLSHLTMFTSRHIFRAAAGSRAPSIQQSRPLQSLLSSLRRSHPIHPSNIPLRLSLSIRRPLPRFLLPHGGSNIAQDSAFTVKYRIPPAGPNIACRIQSRISSCRPLHECLNAGIPPVGASKLARIAAFGRA
jgi:hypothetical protein